MIVARVCLALSLLLAAGCDEQVYESAAAPAPQQPTDPALTQIAARPPPAFTSEYDRNRVEILTPSEPGVLAHIGRRFVLRYPAEWTAVRAIIDGDVNYLLTPDREVDPRKIRRGIKVRISSLPRTSELSGKDPLSLMRHIAPAVRGSNPGMQPDGKPGRTRIGSLAAAQLAFVGPLLKHKGRFRVMYRLAPHRNEQYYVGSFAPVEEYGNYAEVFEKIVADSEFGRPAPTRQSRSFEARHIVQRHKASTISIVAGEDGKDVSTGTGFLISQNGYLLTNWHVIFNQKKNRPWSSFRVEWDPSAGRPAARARLIKHSVQARLMKAHQISRTWGTDIALLKIDAGDYPVFELSPLEDVEPGDGVVTLGFPSRGILKDLAITITRGVVTRFNRGPRGDIRSIFTDAAITHGSSGGPCVSLVTGGVVGLNTFGQPIERGASAGGQDLNDLVNYFGVVPIDACLREFPLVCDLGRSHQIDDLGFFDCYELAHTFQSRASRSLAGALADRAVSLKPNSSDALYLKALARIQQAYAIGEERGTGVDKFKLGIAMIALQAVLIAESGHIPTLTRLARLSLAENKLADAVRYADRAIKEAPDRWHVHDLRADIAYRQKKYAECLRYAAEAKRVCGNAYAEPSMTAGAAHYADKNWDAGRAEYRNAVSIHTLSVPARVGVARYHELQRHTNAALTEYKKILIDFPNNAQVLYRMGMTCATAKRHKDSANFLYGSVRAYQAGGERPPNSAFDWLTRAFEEQKDFRTALIVCGQWLSHVKSGVGADTAHIRAQLMANKLKLYGLAHAHLRIADRLTKNKDTKAQIAKIRLKPLALSEVATMKKLGYRSEVAIPMLRISQRTFAVRTKTEMANCVKLGIPVDWIAVLYATPKLVTKPKSIPLKTTKPKPKPKPSSGLTGTWRASTTLNGRATIVVLRLTSTRRYVMESYVNGRKTGSDTGTYSISGLSLVFRDRKGTTWRPTYSLWRNTLTIKTKDRGSMRFTRQR